ncbi:MAG: hypothetical protein ACKVQK_07405 [Burkholderiales bacterium]
MQAKRRSGTPSAANSTSKQPEPVCFFVDESLDSMIVASALRDAGANIERAADHFPKGSLDEVWLTEVGQKGWVVLTRDKRIRYRQLERLALKSARVRAFVFIGGNVTMQETGEILVKALDRMTKIVRAVPGPFIYHLGRSGSPVRMD